MTCLLLWNVAPSAMAEAAGVLNAEVQSDAEEVRLLLRTHGQLQAPRVIPSPGLLRFWFAGAPRQIYLDTRGDSERVRRVVIRPGVEDTTVVAFR
ncbi:MAG: hypothetical protein ACPGUV_13435, partial [Polyangiales bacterium]